MALPINIKSLFVGQVIESDRIEFKAGWNPNVVIRTICAFANDFENIGGGYIVVGVSETDGVANLPPIGLQASQIDSIQKQLYEMCHFITPHYFPQTEVVKIEGVFVLVIWCPPGDVRPYKAPKTLGKQDKGSKQFYIRKLSSTVQPKDADLTQLMQLTAKVPFDNRVNQLASIEDMDLTLMAAFLKDIGSSLYYDLPKISFEEVCIQMSIARGPKEALLPVNVGLLMFSDDPAKFFLKAQIEVVEYFDEIGDQFNERTFNGPIHEQLKAVLNYLKSTIVKEQVRKVEGQAEVVRFYNYPYEALEEAVANAVFHKSYEKASPIEINIRPDCIEILSFPGPVPPVDAEMLKRPRVVARDYRNSRIGEFLKELRLTEGRGTGLPKMRALFRQNGSPKPVFETDADRGYFLTTFYPHPMFLDAMINDLTDSAGTKLGSSWDQVKLNKNSMLGFFKLHLAPSWHQAGTKLELTDDQFFLLQGLEGEMSLVELMGLVNRLDRTKFRRDVLNALLACKIVELTLPEKPTSPHQKYQISKVLTEPNKEPV